MSGDRFMYKGNNTMLLRLCAGIVDGFIIALISGCIYGLLSTVGISIVALTIIMPLIYITYYSTFETSKMRATAGKRLAGLTVCSEHKRRIRYSIALTRSIIALASTLFLGVGFWIGFFSADGKTLCDTATGTRVAAAKEKKINMGKPMVKVVNASLEEKCYDVSNGGLTFGRDREKCNVIFATDEPAVSRCHCTLNYNAKTNTFMLEDLFSSQGTFIKNGTRVVPGKISILNDGDCFYLGTPQNTFCVTGREM